MVVSEKMLSRFDHTIPVLDRVAVYNNAFVLFSGS
jgi:hypothetical protein